MKKFTMISGAVAVAVAVVPSALRADEKCSMPPPMKKTMCGKPAPCGKKMPEAFPAERKAVKDALDAYRKDPTEANKAALKAAVSKLTAAHAARMVEQAEKQLERAKEMAAKQNEMTDKIVERMIAPPQKKNGALEMLLTAEEHQKFRAIFGTLRKKEVAEADKICQLPALKALCQKALDRLPAEIDKAKAEKKDTGHLERCGIMLKKMIAEMNDDPEDFVEDIEEMKPRPPRGPHHGPHHGQFR